jgi:CrcB protein
MMWAAVALGGAIGSVARHGVNALVSAMGGRPSPFSTFLVNMTGCFVIGLLAGLIAADRLEMSVSVRAFIFVGILGGFTTFSSFMLDTLTLANSGHVAAGLTNAVAQIVVGYALVYGGYRLAVMAV